MKKNGTNGTSNEPRLSAAAVLQMKTLVSKRDKLARQHRIAAMELETFLLKELEKMDVVISGEIVVSEDGAITQKATESSPS